MKALVSRVLLIIVTLCALASMVLPPPAAAKATMMAQSHTGVITKEATEAEKTAAATIPSLPPECPSPSGLLVTMGGEVLEAALGGVSVKGLDTTLGMYPDYWNAVGVGPSGTDVFWERDRLALTANGFSDPLGGPALKTLGLLHSYSPQWENSGGAVKLYGRVRLYNKLLNGGQCTDVEVDISRTPLTGGAATFQYHKWEWYYSGNDFWTYILE